MHLPGTVTLADELEYPATTDELIAAYGDQPIELPNGTETVGDALGRISRETFESPDEFRLTLQSALSDKAVGRVGYSDRDPNPPGSVYQPQQLSF
ncbi:hypothetical protein Halru_2770 [Halovivax ruber XH-70]|uniref:DUF2795 domain-containing protein n=1 Tax=Halovivax ruber (strain DSM 18193 / JCM 13892 / XH-70) TaxID=797302 RepID=L0IF17_HALRX|nr:hypothetical protein [Halovivax ruber]AGB17344.1 hypothetical protein Halru_2770 [Halovivax ruber XH-70]